jgi:dTDP-4-dehydrorhamnose reductase
MKILVLGSKGQLGRCLFDQLDDTRHIVVYASRDELDIANTNATNELITAQNPDLVINTAAYTAVDKAESDKEVAYLINNLAVAAIAAACRDNDSLLIHISTDYVFDGTADQPYTETNPTSPNSVYGDSKLKGELSIQESGCNYLIIRTAWVFSQYGNNFLKTMIRLGGERDEVSVVGDQIGCPTYAQDIAKAIVLIISKLNIKDPMTEIYHYSGDQSCSWFDFAQAIFSEANNLTFPIPKIVRSINTAEYATDAPRPKYSVLECSKISADFSVEPSNWQVGIQEALWALKNV